MDASAPGSDTKSLSAGILSTENIATNVRIIFFVTIMCTRENLNQIKNSSNNLNPSYPRFLSDLAHERIRTIRRSSFELKTTPSGRSSVSHPSKNIVPTGKLTVFSAA